MVSGGRHLGVYLQAARITTPTAVLETLSTTAETHLTDTPAGEREREERGRQRERDRERALEVSGHDNTVRMTSPW